MALRRRLKLELAKPQWAAHPLNQGEHTIEEKAFRLRDFAAEGDALAVSIFKQQGFILGFAIADLVRVFDPGLVVIGGGLAETSFRDQYMAWIEEGFADRAWPVYRFSPLDPTQQTTRFEWALGGDAAAAIGMAYAARDLFQ
jgi:predicted NBD/HSP70 family sugar kinase